VSDQVLTSASLPGRWTRGRWVVVTAAAGGLRARRRTAFLLIERPRGRDGLTRSYRGSKGESTWGSGFSTTCVSYHRHEKPGKRADPHPPVRRSLVLRSGGFPRPPLGPSGPEG